MPAIDLTPAQVNTEIASPKARPAVTPAPAPPLDTASVRILLFRNDGGQIVADVSWEGDSGLPVRVVLPINTAIPVADRAAFRVALGRLLIAARESIGAV